MSAADIEAAQVVTRDCLILNMTVARFMLKLLNLTFDLLIFEIRFNDK